LANHLGNVLTVISDKKTAICTGNTFNYFAAERISATDYSPFGATLAGRSWNGGEYRYGFNGKENDNDVKGNGNQQDYGMRIHDTRLGRFLSVDPLASSYPWYTPFQFAGNKPIWAIDLDGLEEYFTSSGELIGKFGDNSEIRIVFDEYILATKNLIINQGKNNPDLVVTNNLIYNKGSAGAFKSSDDAASDWGYRYNQQSISNNKEYSSWIFFVKINGSGFFSYTKPVEGKESETENKYTKKVGRTLVAYIHSHGAYSTDYLSNQFSPEEFIDKNGNKTKGDIGVFKDLGVVGYVTTPNGSLKKWPSSENEDVLKCDLPSDPKDPTTDSNQKPKTVSQTELFENKK
jgi:RHS repeat-associated protein